MRSFVVPGKDGAKPRAVTTHKGGKHLIPWRQNVGWIAKEAWAAEPVDGPVSVHIHFKFQRPASHFGKGKNANMVKSGAPIAHIQSPDIDKLARAILDALTGIIFIDDRQVNELFCSRCWVEHGQGALIVIETENGPKEFKCSQ